MSNSHDHMTVSLGEALSVFQTGGRMNELKSCICTDDWIQRKTTTKKLSSKVFCVVDEGDAFMADGGNEYV